MNEISLIGMLAAASLLPLILASGTCFVKFSIVFVLVRNALGVQQVPSNLTLNSIAFMMSMFVMSPVVKQTYIYYKTENVKLDSVESVVNFTENGLSSYRGYLTKYSDPELLSFFDKAQSGSLEEKVAGKQEVEEASILALLPAYALTEVKEAFKIGFYLYLPFVVIDLVISSILLALGMMMMSPVTISVPIKLILFVTMDGWTLLSKGLVLQYIELAK